MKKSILIIVLFAFVSTAQGAGESISIGSFDINAGSVVEVPVLIGNAADVAGGKVTIGYNSSVITVDGVLPGDFGAPITKVDSSGRFLEVSAASATAAGKNEAVLAIIKFRGIGVGKSDLTIRQEYYVNDIKGNLYTHVAKNGSIIIRASALPASETTPEKTEATVPAPVPTSEQVTIKATPLATVTGSAVRIYPDETAALPAKNKEIPGFEADIVILLFAMLLNRKKLPPRM
jgi:hypothetical protein